MALKSRFVRHVVLWALAAPAALLLAAPAFMGPDAYGLRQAEILAAERIYGREAHARLKSAADQAFRRLFIDSGAVGWSMRVFVVNREGPLGTERAAGTVSARWIEAFWLALYQGLYRATLAAQWLWAALALTLAAFADGLAARAIRRSGWGYNNPYAFHVAAHGLIALLGAAFAFLFMPVAVHPVVYPAGCAATAFAAWHAAANFQTGG